MNYKYLVKKGLSRFLDESDLSVGEILRAVTSERLTGIKTENRSRFLEITDKEWNSIIEKAFEYEQED